MTDIERIEKLERRVTRLEEFITEIVGDLRGDSFVEEKQDKVVNAWGDFIKEAMYD